MNSKIRLLLVEGNPGDVRLIMEILKENKKVEFTITNSARLDKSLKLLDEKQFEMILLDLELPDSQGLETFKKVRSHVPGLPIVILSGLKDENLALQAIKEGAQDYLTKSDINSNNLVRIVQYAIERKQAKEDLKESENKYRAIFESTGTATLIVDMNTLIIQANKECESVTGYSASKLVGKSWTQFVYEQDLSMMLRRSKERTKDSESATDKYEVRLVNSKGEIRNTILSIGMTPDGKTSIVSMLDITERKKVEEALHNSEENYRLLFTNIGEGVATVDLEENFVYCNPAAESIFGVPAGKLVGKNLNEFLNPQMLEFVKNQSDKRKKGKKNTYEFEIIRNDKTNRQLLITVTPQYDMERNLIGSFGLFHDITERKQAEKKSRQQQEQLLAIFGGMNEVVYIADPNTYELLYQNNMVKEVWGDIASGKCYKVLQDRNSPCPFCTNNKIFGENLGKTYTWEFKNEVNKHWYRCSDRAIQWPNGKMVRFELAIDITDRKQSEEIQKTLFNISNTINTTDSLSELYGKVKEILGNVINTENFLVALYDDKADMISLPFLVDEKDQFKTYPAGKTMTKYVIETGKPLFATNDVVDELTQKGFIEAIGTPSEIWLGVPLKIEKKIIGIISVQSYDDPNQYTEKDLEILTFVSEEIALAIKHKQKDEQIEKDLAEKSLLLQEIYHRTKNNMQLIISLLKLEAKNMETKSLTENVGIKLLHDSYTVIANKIKSMSLVHEKLYKANDLSHINLKEYIEDLVKQLLVTYNTRSEKIKLKFELEDVYILIDSAIPLGLILSELITNVFKHAFPNNAEGEISVRLFKEKDDTINLLLGDNGVGIPKDIDLEKIETMGIQTVFSLIKYQLGGQIRYDTDNGMKWNFKFKDNQYKKRV